MDFDRHAGSSEMRGCNESIAARGGTGTDGDAVRSRRIGSRPRNEIRSAIFVAALTPPLLGARDTAHFNLVALPATRPDFVNSQSFSPGDLHKRIGMSAPFRNRASVVIRRGCP